MQMYELPSKPGTDMSGPLTDLLHTMAGAGGGMLGLPVGNIICNSGVPLPDMNGISVLGPGRGCSQLDFFGSKTGGLIASGKKRIYHNSFRDFSLRGPGSGIGLELTNWDRGCLERLRVYNWGTCVRIKSDSGFGALRNKVLDSILTNGVDYALHLTGDQGAHACFVGWCELGSSGVGGGVDAPTDETTFWDVQLEANKQAARIAGNRGLYYCRLEGNGADFDFAPGSSKNLLLTGYFDPAKHTDRNGDSSTNQILAFGYNGTAASLPPRELLSSLMGVISRGAIGDGQMSTLQSQVLGFQTQIEQQSQQGQTLQEQIAGVAAQQAQQIQQMQADWLNQQQIQAQAMHDLNADVAGLLLRLQKLEAAEMAGIAAYRGETLGTSTP